MKKYKVVIIIAILFLVGLCSVKVSTGDFFLTTKYYKTALAAYNAGRTSIAFLGDTEAKSEMGVLTLDDETCLFIGEVDADHFVVGEMAIKNGRFALKGCTYLYDLSAASDGLNSQQTNISEGSVRWSVLYDRSEFEELSNVVYSESYVHSAGRVIYVVLLTE